MKARAKRLWPDSTIVCVGTGPSLTQADVDFCRGKARVIAVNDAYRLAPWADVLYACDGRWWDWHKGVKEFRGLKFGMTIRKHLHADVIRLRNAGSKGLCLESDGLCTGRNSGYQAINLAVHLGAARILLLGYDMTRDRNGRSHFFGEHPRQGLPSPYPAFRQMFPTLVKPLAQLGIEVINCTQATALETFPKQPLDEALRMPLEVAS